MPRPGILLLTALTTTTVATPCVLTLPAFATLLLAIATLGGATTLLLIAILGPFVLTPAALGRSATTPTTTAVISSVPIPPLHLGAGTGRPYTGSKARLDLLQAEHRSGGLDENLHLKLVFSHTQSIQSAFLCFIQ
jgi:hypothetical protein